MPRTFQLAPMDRTMWILTSLIVLIGPAIILFTPRHLMMWPAGALLLALIALVYLLWRPSAFVVDGGALTIMYPLRTRKYALDELTAAQPIDSKAFRSRFRYGLRVGVGGLFGGFGWLKVSGGWVEMDISRVNDMVLLEWKDRSPLLVTPQRPDDFIATVRHEAGLPA